MSDGTPAKVITTQLRNLRTIYAPVHDRQKIKRSLIWRTVSDQVQGNGTGTNIPEPFDKSSLIIRTMMGEPSKAVQHYAGRIGGNLPDIKVIPLSAKGQLTSTMDKLAGEQERLDNQLWQEACTSEDGGRGEQWVMGMAMALGGVGYYFTLPREMTFGLPDREFYGDRSEEEVEDLRRAGLIAPAKAKNPRTGAYEPAESAEAWAKRRQAAMQENKVAGRKLFTLRALPRDQVYRLKDTEGIKEAWIVEEVPRTDFGPGSEWARMLARKHGQDEQRYGLYLDRHGKVCGGITEGTPEGYQRRAPDAWTFITYLNREEIVYLVASRGNPDGAMEVWRAKHGATIQSAPVCPIVEVPCVRGDTDAPEYEFLSPLDPLFAVVPVINQLMTLRSNASAYNLIPRFVVELHPNGGPIRDPETSEPRDYAAAPTPGLNPSQMAAYPGTVTQLTVDVTGADQSIEMLLNRLDSYMPAPVTEGSAGASAPAWQVRQLIQQAQENLRQPVDNHASAVKSIIQMWHGWLRKLDVPVYFWPSSRGRSDKREFRGLIEFDPKNLTDSIKVTQELDTPDEALALDALGQEKLAKGLITKEEYFENYARVQDAYQATIDSYAQMVADSLLTTPAAGQPQLGPLLMYVRDRVMGRLQVELPQMSENAARGQARSMVANAHQQTMQAMGSNPAVQAGVVQPGQGMPLTMEQARPDMLPAPRPPVAA